MYNFLDWGGGLAMQTLRSFFDIEPDEAEELTGSAPV
jgi:hypothetical protein